MKCGAIELYYWFCGTILLRIESVPAPDEEEEEDPNPIFILHGFSVDIEQNTFTPVHLWLPCTPQLIVCPNINVLWSACHPSPHPLYDQ